MQPSCEVSQPAPGAWPHDLQHAELGSLAHAARKQALLDVLRDWRIASSYHTRDWASAYR